MTSTRVSGFEPSRRQLGRGVISIGIGAFGLTQGVGSAFADSKQPPTAPATHKLAVRYQVSPLKAPGCAGLVAIHLVNVGTETYYMHSPQAKFRVEVHTAKGPKGVARAMTPGYFNGAHMSDLGFDAATSVHAFDVVLSHPIDPGHNQLVANIAFSDGLTREGRVINEIITTQTVRMDDDHPTESNTDVLSRFHTWSDFGKRHPGLF
ncbi:hypothetical protein [Devriesea agamarum]|uniref:hypothetical protein n=1 Tax=Devriesea agamarum TaxID=472569 RepID=UPI00071D5BE1|nr:hypothetical protein [Devriesea agamarum]